MDLPYARSKIASERVARELQDGGAPVVTVYPGGVLGPHDPYLGDQAARLAWIVRGRLAVWPRGGLHYVDVRDVGATIAAVVEPGLGPRRFVVPGHHVRDGDLHHVVSSVVGRRRPALTLPVAAMLPALRALDTAKHRLPRRQHPPVGVEGATLLGRDTAMHDQPARTELGIDPRPLADSVRDTVAWLVTAGHLPERYRPRRQTTICAVGSG